MSDGTTTNPVESTDQGAATEAASAPESNGLRLLLISFDLLLLVVVVLGTTGTLNALLAAFGLPNVEFPVTVPWYVYSFAVLGALGYVFTKLVKNPDRSFGALLHANIRLPASLPLAAGFYLLAGQFLGSEPPADLMAGIAFLTGLFVNIAYRRIGALAKRLLPEEEKRDTAAADGGGVETDGGGGVETDGGGGSAKTEG